jgi:hypothetical protein
MTKQIVIVALALLFCSAAVHAQQPAAAPTPPIAAQTEADEYTRYELLAPETASFKIHYEVTATTAGAKVYFNPIRKGSTASDEAVYDVMTGEPLRFEVVSGTEARKDPLMTAADPSGSYIRVQLARPVPPEGQARILIVKTYQDAKSYYRDGETIVFNRGLGIKRNSVVLPQGFELVACNVPSQVLTEPDGRVAISFMNAGAGEAPLILRAKRGAQTGPSAAPHPLTQTRSWEAPFPGETERERLSERAHQDRDIVYFLQQPETHAFSLYHDYTESRPGVDKYLNIVREGSTVFRSIGVYPRHRRKTFDAAVDRCRSRCRKNRIRRTGKAGGASRGDSISSGEKGAVDSLANLRNVHRSRQLSIGRRRTGL